MLGDVFISAELKGYICYLLYPYTLGKEVSQRLRGGRKERWCKLPYHSSIFPGCGSWDLYLTASVTSLFPNNPILQLTRGAVLLLQVSTWACQVAWPHSSCPSKPEIWRFLCLFSLIPHIESLWFATCPPLYLHLASSGLGCLFDWT